MQSGAAPESNYLHYNIKDLDGTLAVDKYKKPLQISVDPEWSKQFLTNASDELKQATLNKVVFSLMQKLLTEDHEQRGFCKKIGLHIVYVMLEENSGVVKVWFIAGDTPTNCYSTSVSIATLESTMSPDSVEARPVGQVGSLRVINVKKEIADQVQQTFKNYIDTQLKITFKFLIPVKRLSQQYVELGKKVTAISTRIKNGMAKTDDLIHKLHYAIEQFSLAKGVATVPKDFFKTLSATLTQANKNHDTNINTIENTFQQELTKHLVSYQQGMLFPNSDNNPEKLLLDNSHATDAELAKKYDVEIEAFDKSLQAIVDKIAKKESESLAKLSTVLGKFLQAYRDYLANVREEVNRVRSEYILNSASYTSISQTLAQNLGEHLRNAPTSMDLLENKLVELSTAKDNLMTNGADIAYIARVAGLAKPIVEGAKQIQTQKQTITAYHSEIVNEKPAFEKLSYIYSALKFILTQNKLFWTNRVKTYRLSRGEEVLVNGESYTVPFKAAQMIKDLVKLAPNATPQEGINTIVAAYTNVKTDEIMRDETKIGYITNYMTSFSRSPKTSEFYEIIDLLIGLSDINLKSNIAAYDKIIESIHTFLDAYKDKYDFINRAPVRPDVRAVI